MPTCVICGNLWNINNDLSYFIANHQAACALRHLHKEQQRRAKLEEEIYRLQGENAALRSLQVENRLMRNLLLRQLPDVAVPSKEGEPGGGQQ